MELTLIPIVNFVFWFVIYSVAAYLLIIVLRHLDVRGMKNEPVSSAVIGLVGTILDTAATSSSQGPVTNLSLLPMTVTQSGSPQAIPAYAGTLAVFAVAFVIVYFLARE